MHVFELRSSLAREKGDFVSLMTTVYADRPSPINHQTLSFCSVENTAVHTGD